MSVKSHDEKVRIKAVCATPKVAYRLMKGDVLVGMALAYTNGTWGLYSTDEKCISAARMKSPQLVAKQAEDLGMGTCQ